MITDEGEVRQALALFKMRYMQLENWLDDETITPQNQLKLIIELLEVKGKIKALKWILGIE